MRLTCMLLAIAWASETAGAQEFVRQQILVANFASPAGPTKSGTYPFGRHAADQVRSQLNRLTDRKQAAVISGGDVTNYLGRMEVNDDTVFAESDVAVFAKTFRADEYVVGTALQRGSVVEIAGELVLTRNRQLRQPLSRVRAGTLGRAATLFGQAIAAARAQLVFERRCENAVREGDYQLAQREAQAGIRAYAGATIARSCSLLALTSTGANAEDVDRSSRELLALDSLNFFAIDAAALAADALHRTAEAAVLWTKLTALEPDRVDVIRRSVEMLLAHGNAGAAEPIIMRVTDENPDSVGLWRLRWAVQTELKEWSRSVITGEHVLADTTAARDSSLQLRLALAYDAAGERPRALEYAARGMRRFPGDPRLNALYARLTRAEALVAVNRGLEHFPASPDLLVMRAEDLKGSGKLAAAADAYRRALRADSLLAHGQLVLAQTFFDLGLYDSVRVAVHAAVRAGEDSATVARFALSKGSVLYRAATAAQSADSLRAALDILLLADSLGAGPSGALLVSAAAIGVARAELSSQSSTTPKERRCESSKSARDLTAVARSRLARAAETQADASRQLSEAAAALDPYVARYLATYCGSG